MVTAWYRNLCQPDEVREYPRARTEVVKRADFSIERSTFQPGWRWSDHVAEPSCHYPHTGYLISGRLRVLMEDGEEFELRAGDAYRIGAGHDTWTVGDEPCVSIEFSFAPPKKEKWK